MKALWYTLKWTSIISSGPSTVFQNKQHKMMSFRMGAYVLHNRQLLTLLAISANFDLQLCHEFDCNQEASLQFKHLAIVASCDKELTFTLAWCNLSFKVNSHQAKANAKAKIPFDDCRLFSDLFRLFVWSFRFRLRFRFGVIRPLDKGNKVFFPFCCRRRRTAPTS